ncbi:MAG: hypothetical protein RLZZ630_484 [Bacteroidota bacterium]
MIIGELKSQINKVWENFWTGSFSKPFSVLVLLKLYQASRIVLQIETSGRNFEAA